MSVLEQESLFLQEFTLPSFKQNSLHQIVKFEIDKNLSVKLSIKQIKGSILFHGTILYHNGLQLKLPTKSWGLISQYSQLKISNLLFLYDFNQQTVNFTSKILVSPKLRPSIKFIQQHRRNILKHVKSFTSTLYRYRILNFSLNFSFPQFWEETKLKIKLCTQLRHGKLTSQIINARNFSKPSGMIDEKEDFQSSSNIQKYRITQCNVEDVEEIPKELQGGPKNLKFNFRNKSGSSIISGGFFEIEKLFCCLQKKLQISNQSNLKSDGQYGDVTDSNFGNKNEVFQQKYDILVRKTLKQIKKQHESNRLKISKELIIVQQIKNKTHLLTYYKNTLKESRFGYSSSPEMLRRTKESNRSSLMFIQDSNTQMDQRQDNKKFRYETEIYMQFHPHTLKDIIGKPNRSLEETLDTCLQLLEATVHLHESGVIHRDIKPQNVLIDYTTSNKSQVVKLIDFAESAIHTKERIKSQIQKEAKEAISQIFYTHNSRLYGATLPYSPPECQHQRNQRTSPGVNSFKIDSWSIGMILPEIYHNKKFVNFPKPYADDIISLIKDSGFETHNSRVNKKGFDMAQSLITYIGMKNTFYKPDLRLDVIRSYRAFMILSNEYEKWQKTIRIQSSKHRFQYSMA